MQAFLLAELGTSGSVDANNQLIIKGRFQQKQLENVLRRYISKCLERVHNVYDRDFLPFLQESTLRVKLAVHLKRSCRKKLDCFSCNVKHAVPVGLSPASRAAFRLLLVNVPRFARRMPKLFIINFSCIINFTLCI